MPTDQAGQAGMADKTARMEPENAESSTALVEATRVMG
jgi:hypothetical protein